MQRMDNAGTPDAPTILVVDDEPSMQRVLNRLLAFHRFNPLQASNVPQATVIAERQQVDAFVVDLKLGGGQSGLEMLEWLRRQQAYMITPVFVVTGNFDIPEEQQTLIQQHRAHIFYKGQSLELLIHDLTRVLGQRKGEAALDESWSCALDPRISE